MSDTGKTILCPSCGAGFDAGLASCPYCGYVSRPGDEKEYLKDLNASKDAVLEMVDIPEETLTREARHTGKMIVIVLIVLAVIGTALFFLFRSVMKNAEYKRDEAADYLWTQEHIPELQAAYDEGMENGDFTKLGELYEKAMREDAPVWNFSHDTFANLIFYMRRADEDTAAYTERSASMDEEQKLNYLTGIFYYEMSLYVAETCWVLDERETEMIRSIRGPYVEDLKERFSLTDEDLENFRKEQHDIGYLSYTTCSDYVRKLLGK